MTDQFFAGSYGGSADKLSDEARLECKICWYLYDPAQGDPYWQIPPGTPFSRLPEDWSCPNCDGRKDDFMVVL
ncbi:rubredoxin [Sedimenticola thiotaurini]|uniref:Rubredoxin n=1 Tax=Sedimenticola thiotaurini TaxID=1543721 RepID=A0A0F7JZL4_9GAMM|nr:rubredoxin [Sedimenticola thiotaurini]AKH21756.1 rubredoxin [Sedimenticola thiotaurini]